MKELLVSVDPEDNILGPVDRLQAHLDQGILHRGLVVVVKNFHNEVLLTQRSMERPDLGFPPLFPGFWDVTLAGHPKWGEMDYVAQMGKEVQEELGMSVDVNSIAYLGKFQYYAPDPSYPNIRTAPTFKLSEREICGVGVLHTDVTPVLNSVELKSSMWVKSERLVEQLKTLAVAPWALLVVEKFAQILKE